MRKFFKGLAVLLALVLVVGVIPAAAADNLSLQKEKILYLDGSKGAKEDGTQCKTSYKKLVANMIKGFDKDTMSVALSSADKSIVSTTKAGRIKAKSIGTTTVTVTVYDAAETEIFKQDLVVKVKKNAADVTVTGIADGDKFKVGQTVDVTLPRAGVDTDDRELTVDKADNVEIKAGEKSRTWTVKFLKSGDVTFTAKAYQSAKYPAATAKKEIKVSVANPAPTGIKVVASNAYELTFDTDVEAAGLFKSAQEIANDACYYMLSDTKVTFSAIKEIKATGNTVKVTMYDNFADGTTYYVVVNECEPLSFVIAGNAAKDVESIAIITDTVEVNKAVEIKVALYNKDGVDITNSVGTDSVTYKSSNLNSYVDGKTLNMYNVGDVTDLTATFTYYDPNNNYEAKTKTATKKITAVAQSADVIEKIVFSVDNNNGTAINANYANAKNYVALGDGNYYFKAWAVAKNGNADVSFEVKDNTVNYNGKSVFAKIPEESIALLGNYVADIDGNAANGTAGGYPITPNSVGKTNVFIGYNDDSGKFVTLKVCSIEVKAARYPSTLTVKPSKSNLNTTATNDDSLKVEAEVKDQYGDGISGLSLVVSQNDQSKGFALFTPNAFTNDYGGHYVTTVTKSAISYQKDDHSANIVFTTKVDRWDAKTPTVGCNFTAKDNGGQNPASDSVSFVNNGVSTLDTTITATSVLKQANLQATTSKNGYYTGNVGLTLVQNAPTKDNVATGSGINFYLTIRKDSKEIYNNTTIASEGLTGFLDITNVGAGNVTLRNFKVSGSVVSKLPKATYVFTVYKVSAGAQNKTDTVISSMATVVSVTDNQAAPTFVQTSETAAATDLSANNLHGCFKFYFGGSEYKAAADVSYGLDLYGNPCVTDASGSTDAKFVKKAVVTVDVSLKDEINWGDNTDVTFDLETNINKLIKKASN